MMLRECRLCPRECGSDRSGGKTGFCGCTEQPSVASICMHKGEEPVLCGTKGICNVFFSHCNLQCVYCQNIDISDNRSTRSRYNDLGSIVARIAEILPQTENVLGFVSPSHQAHWIPEILEGLKNLGFSPTVVYNTNAYDSVETLRLLEPYIDIYLPDFKYSDNDLAKRYSQAGDYFGVASKAIAEMYRQKGSTLMTDENEVAVSGLIIRHLVLPGCVENSTNALSWIAENVSVNVHLSLMAQYYPPKNSGNLPDELNRFLSEEEYTAVCEHSRNLGFHRGWEQQLNEKVVYRPHFENENSFEQNRFSHEEEG